MVLKHIVKHRRANTEKWKQWLAVEGNCLEDGEIGLEDVVEPEGTPNRLRLLIGDGQWHTYETMPKIDMPNYARVEGDAIVSKGYDYAEYFEWLDGNIDNEDRRGYFVTMDGDKIKKAKEGDYILGIVSAYPAVIGNNDMEWSGKFLLDEFGDPIKKVQKTIIKEHELNEDVCFTDEEMKTLTDEERKQREMREVEREVETEYFVLNPDFDPDKEYIHRADRPEWDTIGMLGVLAVFDDGTCQVNGFCKCNDDGVATACERGFDTYRVIERINDRLIKVVFK
jgi:hypothetical protein